jgi:hypothetical protein
MFVTGPDVVKTVTNEIVTAEELGGARTHTQKSSVADGAYEDDVETLEQVRRLFDFLPLNNREKPPVRPFHDDPARIDQRLDTLIPSSATQPYDMKELIRAISSRFRKPSPATSSPASSAWKARRSASSPTSRWFSPAASTSIPRARPRASSASATPSRSRS